MAPPTPDLAHAAPQVNGLLHVHLADGPTAHFRISNLVLGQDIKVGPGPPACSASTFGDTHVLLQELIVAPSGVVSGRGGSYAAPAAPVRHSSKHHPLYAGKHLGNVARSVSWHCTLRITHLEGFLDWWCRVMGEPAVIALRSC